VRTSETACPFCSAPLDLSNEPPPLLPVRPLSRSALFSFKDLVRVGALTATTSGVMVACYSVQPAYGDSGAPFEAAGSSGQAGAQGVGGASGKGGTSGTSGDAGAAGEGQGGEGGR